MRGFICGKVLGFYAEILKLILALKEVELVHWFLADGHNMGGMKTAAIWTV